MAAVGADCGRAAVAFGRRAVAQLFGELREAERRPRVLNSLCDLMHDPERVCQAVRGGFLDQLKDLMKDENPSVRTKTCELLHLITAHSIGRRALLSSSLLQPLCQLMDDSSLSCRKNVHRVLNRLALLPSGGAEALMTRVPKLMLKLKEEEEEEVQVLLLSTLSCCSRLNALPVLSADGVSLLGSRLHHRSPGVRREAAAAMMALSVSAEGKRRVCEEAVLPVLVHLLKDEDVEVQTNAVGVVMNTAVITSGKQQCLQLDVLAVLVALVAQQEDDEEAEKRRKALVLYSLQALTSLAEAPAGRRSLLEELPVLKRRSEAPEEDREIRQAALNAIRVITWTP